MKRFLDEHTTLRGFLIIGLIAAVVVVLSLQSVLLTVGGLLRIAFFLAIAFFLVLAACGYAIFRVWRDEHTYS
jgi:hypothetical protein